MEVLYHIRPHLVRYKYALVTNVLNRRLVNVGITGMVENQPKYALFEMSSVQNMDYDNPQDLMDSICNPSIPYMVVS